MVQTLIKRLLATAFAGCLCGLGTLPSNAMAPLSPKMVNQAVKYGLMNQNVGLYMFLGANWQELDGGTLLNVYTPFIEIARAVARRKFNLDPTDENIAQVKEKVERDIHYTWHHPQVKFMVSMYGDTPDFATKYYAVIEGVGKGRDVRLYPVKRVPSGLAQKELNAKDHPYSAVDTFIFDFKAVQRLDRYTLKLYTDEKAGLPTYEFNLINSRLF